jgi:organic hydroperoxide reductase OsmC/OhrA
MKIMSENEDKKYEIRVAWTGGKSGEVVVESLPPILTGTHPESEKKFYTPEELFVASGAVCFMNSFVYFLEKMHIEIQSFEVVSIGRLEKVDRSFEITEINSHTRVVIDKETSRKKIERALELGAKYCYVANSMKCPTYHDHEIVVVE